MRFSAMSILQYYTNIYITPSSKEVIENHVAPVAMKFFETILRAFNINYMNPVCSTEFDTNNIVFHLRPKFLRIERCLFDVDQISAFFMLFMENLMPLYQGVCPTQRILLVEYNFTTFPPLRNIQKLCATYFSTLISDFQTFNCNNYRLTLEFGASNNGCLVKIFCALWN